jgi:hypothetical protein
MNSLFSCKRIFAIAATVVLAVSAALPVTAQTAATGTISGTVTDVSGAIVPNASVTVINTDTGATRALNANSAGEFTSTFLQPGHYEVIAAGAGFGKVDRKNLVLTVGQVLSVDVALPAASATTEVTVTDASPLIDTDKVQVSQTVSQELVSNLPVNGRRYDNFVLLTTNVVPDGNSGLISYRGISGLYNTNLIDGANNQQAFFSEARGRGIGAPYVFSQDSIKEFESSTSGYSAEFGQAAGGQINAISKNGTNAIHGDLFYYLRYPTLNALDPLTKFNGRQPGANPALLQPAIHQQQQFGGSVGGPIIKDKLFYFFTYDGFRRVQPLLYSSQVSSATLATYACPPAVSSSQCDAAKAYINGLSGPAPRTLKQDIFFPRLDYQLNGSNHISAEFNWQNYKLPNGYTTSTTATNSSASTNGRADFHERFFIANWESVLSPSMTNALRFQWGRDLEVTSANAPGPSVTISGLQGYGMPNALPRLAFPDERRWQISDTLSKLIGNHNLKIGVDVNLIHEYLANLFQGGGVYTYAALNGQCASGIQASPCAPVTFNGQTFTTVAGPQAAFSNWVQDVYGVNGGQHYSSFQQVNDPITHIGADDFWNKNIAAFVEDAWKFNKALTISAGVRYDTQLVPQPPVPYTTSYNGAPSPLGNFYTKTINTNYKMIQPRIGFAWSPYDGTVVRGGYGIFYGLTSNSTFYATRVENGVYQQAYSLSVTQSTTTNPVTYTYANGSPRNIGVLFTPPGLPLAAPFAGAVTPTVNGSAGLQKLSFRGQDPTFTNPYTHSMDLAVEQQLPGHISLTLAYVGTRGMRLPYFIDANLPRTNLTRTYTIRTSATGPATSTVTVPFYSNTLSRPSPNDGGILVGFSGVNSWYHSGAFTIRKPFSHGVEVLINHTWAKAIDGGQVPGQFGTFNGTDTILDPFNLKNPGALSEYSRSDLDMRNRFVGSVVWTPTVGLANRYARYAVNGWSLSGTATEATGLPLTATMSGNASGGIEGGVTGGSVGNSPSPSSGRAPQFRRNSFPSNGVRNIDARLSRDFPIHESIKMQLFVEAFNLANRRQILGYNTTAFQYSTTQGPFDIVPYTGTPGFGTPSSTSSTLYGPRQMQFTAKLFF